NELISSKLNIIKKTGTTSIVAISSYSFDMEACIKSPINTVFLCEVIGSKADMVDTRFADFRSRSNNAEKYASKNF
ncbi:metal-dependent hydrolase, partial [Aliarcobacter butzleri]